MDSTNPFTVNSNFVDLLTSQQRSFIDEPFRFESFTPGGDLGSSQLGEDTPTEHRERKQWTPSDVVSCCLVLVMLFVVYFDHCL
ncbi:hypothetical protein F2Q70_00028185 [Brassica cretica]|uniref:Uncharacterized protein n=1 Tax=Brassica cretica TaxID=69181 RepID=A0A8S9IFX6_BRACR|nr:hypothetical protein F2Q68_00027745 [Brassica cretica]KAF2605392.1 hypothetical protein F2Q70_00028185 [Brassica cretica]